MRNLLRELRYALRQLRRSPKEKRIQVRPSLCSAAALAIFLLALVASPMPAYGAGSEPVAALRAE